MGVLEGKVALIKGAAIAVGDRNAAYRQLSIPRSADVKADIGRAAVLLAGPDASFITGCIISVEGGGSFVA